MKAQINNETIAAFFAQYWGQEVMIVEQSSKIVREEIGPESIILCYYANAYLHLKPLSQISDEDAIEVAKIINDAPFITHKKWQVEKYTKAEAGCDGVKVFARHSARYYTFDFDGQFDHLDEDTDHEMLGYCDFPAAYDFLRSRGYALPFRGLSVNEMKEAGWLKLTEDKLATKPCSNCGQEIPADYLGDCYDCD